MIWFGIGVLITIATYAFAVSRGGGTYLVSYGPMAVGIYCMVRGGIHIARERRAAGSAADRAAAGWDDGPAFTPSPGYQTRAGAMPDGGMRPGAMSMAAAAPPQPDWYPDPRNPAIVRWWDGQVWTNHTRPYT